VVGAVLSNPIGRRAAEEGAGLAAKLARRRSPKLRHAATYLEDWGRRYLLRRAQYLPEELGEVLRSDVIAEGLPRFWTAYEALADRSPTHDQAGVRVLESDIYMRNMLLRDADWAGMAHGVEIRAPLVDVPLYRALCDRAHRCAYSKDDLRRTANRVCPELQFRRRRKTGFMVPRGSGERQGDTELLFGARGLREWNRTVLRRWFGDWVQ
jgi:asparagine synthase (glutamine-hydrolysing)